MSTALWLIGIAYAVLFLHEVSHAFVAWCWHAKIEAFRPWPHMHDGRFYLGRVTAQLPPDSKADFYIAPLQLSSVMAVGICAAALLAGGWQLWYMAGCLVVDALWWLRGYAMTETSDGGKWRRL